MKRETSKAGISYLISGKGPEVIFLHGWAMASTVWMNQLDYFSRKGFTAVAPDLRGHGDSMQKKPYTISRMSSDLNDFICEMRYNRPSLLGWSMGAMVLMDCIARYPGAASLLAFVSSTPQFVLNEDFPCGLKQKDLLGMKARLKRDFKRALLEFRAGITGRIKGADRDIIMEAPLPSYDAATAGLDELLDIDLRGGLSNIREPVLIIHGSRDRVCSPDASRYMAKEIPGAELLIIEEAGHAPFLHESALFNLKLEEFLKRHLRFAS